MLYYTKHARERMMQRGIVEQDVEYCLQNYHTSYPDTKGNLIYRAELPGGRHVKVVLKAGLADSKVIITVGD